MRVELRRGGLLESVHRIDAVVVGMGGVIWQSPGAADSVTFMRSAAKPFQALGLITSGSQERFRFGSEEMALAAASHYGTAEHTRVVSTMLERCGLTVGDLRCGAHPPYDKDAAAALSGPPTALHSNCSGKHAAMLAQCVAAGWDLDYLPLAHPVQQRNRDAVAAFAELEVESIGTGTDGCGVPTFRLPLAAIAVAFRNLVRPTEQTPALADAAARITGAMRAHPYLVGGHGVFGSELMAASGGQLVAKGGAEGLIGIGLGEAGLGIAVKVADGSSRAVAVAAMAVLDRFDLLPPAAGEALASYRRPVVLNVAGHPVGELVPAFD